MKFFTDTRGRAFPVSRIWQVGPEKEEFDARCSDRYVLDVTLDSNDGSTVEITSREAGRLLQASSVVSAEPGWQLARVYSHEAERSLWTAPIIAWGLGSGIAMPFTAAGAWGGGSDSCVFTSPSGQVVCPYEGTWPSVADYLAYLDREEALAEECRAKNPPQGVEAE